MKISVIGPTYPYKGGVSHFTTILVRTLRKHHTVDFISWKRQYPAFLYPVELKDTTSKIPISEEAVFMLDFLNPLTWIQTALEIKSEKSEKVIFTWVSPIQAPIYFVITSLLKMFTNTQIIFVCHNVLPHESTKLDIPLAKLAFRYVDKFIVHSQEDKKKLNNLSKNMQVNEGFVPIYDFLNQGKIYNKKEIKKIFKLKKRVLLFFGYIRPYKGLKYLLQAMPEIIKDYRDTSLLVVGDFWSNDKQLYLDLVQELKIEEHVVFISKYVPDEEIGKYFSVADVAVFPFISATQSASLTTALAFDKPIIATLVGGLKDVMKGSRFSIKSKSSEDIVKKVMLFYKSNNRFNESKSLKSQYTWERYVSLI